MMEPDRQGDVTKPGCPSSYWPLGGVTVIISLRTVLTQKDRGKQWYFYGLL